MEQPNRLFSETKGEQEKEAEHGRPPPSESNEASGSAPPPSESNAASGSRPVPALPSEFLRRIVALGGDDVKMLMEKKLTNSDLSQLASRLYILRRKREEESVEFLTKEEKENLGKKTSDGKRCEEMIVPLIEPNLNESIISLKKWPRRITNSYILSHPWPEVALRNGLKLHDTIQLWSFRVNGSLRLALIKLRI